MSAAAGAPDAPATWGECWGCRLVRPLARIGTAHLCGQCLAELDAL